MVDQEFVNAVRLSVLAIAADTAKVPGAEEVAHRFGRPRPDVEEAFRELADGHVYVLEPGDPARLRMANPYSAVPTPFSVEVGDRTYFANCVWDALGIIALLGGDGRVLTPCPDCKEPQELKVLGRRLVGGKGVVHFSVPARHWWDDIIHT